jgi:hypothetical protein
MCPWRHVGSEVSAGRAMTLGPRHFITVERTTIKPWPDEIGGGWWINVNRRNGRGFTIRYLFQCNQTNSTMRAVRPTA